MMPERTDGAYKADGSLRPAEQEVLGTPVPRKMDFVDSNADWAGFKSPFKHRELVSFYKSELGDDWKVERKRGGTIFKKRGSKDAVYVMRPGTNGGYPSVFIFGDDGDVPNVYGAGSGGRAPVTPSGAPATNSKDDGHYDKTTEKRGGRDVTVLTRKAPRTTTPDGARGPRDDLSRYEKPPGYNPFAGPQVKRKVPRGTLH